MRPILSNATLIWTGLLYSVTSTEASTEVWKPGSEPNWLKTGRPLREFDEVHSSDAPFSLFHPGLFYNWGLLTLNFVHTMLNCHDPLDILIWSKNGCWWWAMTGAWESGTDATALMCWCFSTCHVPVLQLASEQSAVRWTQVEKESCQGVGLLCSSMKKTFSPPLSNTVPDSSICCEWGSFCILNQDRAPYFPSVAFRGDAVLLLYAKLKIANVPLYLSRNNPFFSFPKLKNSPMCCTCDAILFFLTLCKDAKAEAQPAGLCWKVLYGPHHADPLVYPGWRTVNYLSLHWCSKAFKKKENILMFV